MTVFWTSGIGRIAQGGIIQRSAHLFASPKEPTDCFAGGQKTPPILIGGAHIHEMYSKPLVREGLRLASCTKRSQTLGRVRMRGVFM